MATKFKIDKNSNIYKTLENAGKERAKELAKDAREKLSTKYRSLIDLYYQYEPGKDKYDEYYYHRTYQLKKSYRNYYKDHSNKGEFVGGVEITPDKMNDYKSVITGESFSASRLLEKYIVPTTLPSATWHGGNWHGGYGIMDNFSIYEEMIKYRNSLIKYYQS